MRKGYAEEYLCKKELINQYGKINTIKVAISQEGMDFLVFSKGKLVLGVEVKGCHSNKYYPSKKEISQFKRIQEFCKEHNVRGEVWIKHPNKKFIKKEVGELLNGI